MTLQCNSHDGAVVLGASGFVGTRLLHRLVTNGATGLRAIDMLPPRAILPGVRYGSLDVRAPIPAEWAADASVIYNLAAVHRTPGHAGSEYFDTNVAGALNTTALAVECNVETIVFTSSISVYGPCEREVSEVSPLNPISHYGRSKLLAEEIHRRWLLGANTRRLVTVRPGVIFGPGDHGNYTNLARALRRGYFFYPGRKDTVKSGGFVDELLDSIEFALGSPDREVLFNFCYPDQPTIEQIVQTFGRVNGRKYAPLTFPLPLLLAVAGLFELFSKAGLKTNIHRDRVRKLVQCSRVAPAWLASRDYTFETTLESALEQWRDETDGSFT